MRSSTIFNGSHTSSPRGVGRLFESGIHLPRQFVIGIILVLALFAFEMFNFDTTRFALQSLLGEVTFMGIAWATILAIAFCAIDFAGLARLFTPERGRDEPKEVWYLMGAWLLGATMNAVMTWWAVSLTLLNHDLGNEVLSREQLLKVVPFFVAVLVWLTRILFIGAVTMAGERLLSRRRGETENNQTRQQLPSGSPVRGASNGAPGNTSGSKQNAATSVRPTPANLGATPRPPVSNSQPNGRVRQRPPRPAATSDRPTPGNSRYSG